jgi:hypothetical protein
MVSGAMPRDATLVTALILERPLCMECIRSRADLSETEVGLALAQIQRALAIHMDPGCCRACGTHGVVIHSDRPVLGASKGPPSPPRSEASRRAGTPLVDQLE